MTSTQVCALIQREVNMSCFILVLTSLEFKAVEQYRSTGSESANSLELGRQGEENGGEMELKLIQC